jgi:hypothetical protein
VDPYVLLTPDLDAEVPACRPKHRPTSGKFPGYPGIAPAGRKFERRIARTPTTSPRAATTPAPSRPCRTTSAGKVPAKSARVASTTYVIGFSIEMISSQRGAPSTGSSTPAVRRVGNSSVCWIVQNIQSWPFDASARANDSAPTPTLKMDSTTVATSTPPRCRSKANGVTTATMIATCISIGTTSLSARPTSSAGRPSGETS